MNVYKIIFIKKTQISINDEELESIWDYLGCLYKNGQILKNYELIDIEDKLCAFVTFPNDDALNEMNNNIYVNKFKNKICMNYEIVLELVGRSMNHDVSCTCENPSWYILYTNYALIESPVVCGDCGKIVPLYKLPHIHDHEYYDVIGWQMAYKNIDSLWMYGLSDRFTLRQLHNSNSQLSIEGRSICKAFEEKTGKPFYYYIFQNRITNKKCPICNSEWQFVKVGSLIDYKCNCCRIVTNNA